MLALMNFHSGTQADQHSKGILIIKYSEWKFKDTTRVHLIHKMYTFFNNKNNDFETINEKNRV